MTVAPPDRYAQALAYAIERVWNDEAGYQRFRGMRCVRAGRVYASAAFVCRSTFTDRKGRVHHFRGVILADGTPIPD